MLSLALCSFIVLLVANAEEAFATGRRILVTGAGGRTGKIVLEKLLASGRFQVRALVHSSKSKAALLRQFPELQENAVFIGDIEQKDNITPAFKGVAAVVVVTSAVPKLKLWSLIPFLWSKLLGRKGKLRFSWKGGKPEQVDWEGQRNQFDCAKDAGAKQVVLVGTMTGTEKDSFLNSIGEGDGDQIVMWKRKAEMYLIGLCEASNLEYTIIHAGGLSDKDGGATPLVVGVDDKLREIKPAMRIPRADVAEVCVQALNCKAAKSRSFDLGAASNGQVLSKDGLDDLLNTLEGKNCDYSINPPP